MIKRRYFKWKEWKRYSIRGRIYKFLVLLGIVKDDSFLYFVPSTYIGKHEKRTKQ